MKTHSNTILKRKRKKRLTYKVDDDVWHPATDTKIVSFFFFVVVVVVEKVSFQFFLFKCLVFLSLIFLVEVKMPNR